MKSYPIRRTGVYNPDMLNWPASYDTAEKKLEAFRAARESTVPLLRMMTEDDWLRTGTHTESGLYTTENWLTIYANHAHNHAAQIRRLREALNV